MIEKFTIYLGLNDQTTKRQEIETVNAYKIVSNMIAAGLAVLALALVRHWGFMGLVVSGVCYGLWAENQ